MRMRSRRLPLLLAVAALALLAWALVPAGARADEPDAPAAGDAPAAQAPQGQAAPGSAKGGDAKGGDAKGGGANGGGANGGDDNDADGKGAVARAQAEARKRAIRKLRSKIRKLARDPRALRKQPEMLKNLEALAALGGREAGRVALEALPHPAQEVRDAAFAIVEREHDKSLVAPLAKLLDGNEFRRDADARRRIAHALAVMSDPSAIEPLSTLIAFDEDPGVVAEAADALASYAGAPVKDRKIAVRRLVDLYETTWNLKESVRTESKDKILKKEATDHYKVYGKSLRQALQALTGVQLVRPHEWRDWWNANKKRSKWGRHSVMPKSSHRR
jgi:plasmid stabilization system protein ParE